MIDSRERGVLRKKRWEPEGLRRLGWRWAGVGMVFLSLVLGTGAADSAITGTGAASSFFPDQGAPSDRVQAWRDQWDEDLKQWDGLDQIIAKAFESETGWKDLSGDSPAGVGPAWENDFPDEDEAETLSVSPRASPLKKSSILSGKVVDAVQFKEAPLIEVLTLLSQKTGVNIVAGDELKGRVTVDLKNVSLEDALQLVLETHRLAYLEENGVIRIMTAQEYESRLGRPFGRDIMTRVICLRHVQPGKLTSSLQKAVSPQGKLLTDDASQTLVVMDTPENVEAVERLARAMDKRLPTEVFSLTYARAEDVAAQITDWLSPGLGRVKADAASNTVIVRDTPAVLTALRPVVQVLDGKPRQVQIEAKIVQVVLNDEFKLGVDWEAIVKDAHQLDFKSNFDILGGNDKRGRVSIGSLDKDDYTAVLEALKVAGHTHILSSPRITALNNEEARILVGSTEPYVTTTVTTPATGPTTTAESVNFIDVGVKLTVKPVIHRDGFITLTLRPEVSAVTSTVVTSQNNTIPVVDSSEAETTVMVKDGTTLVIGGLIKNENITTRQKVPVLGDVPLVGAVFRNHDETTKKTEIVIFLTPRIVSGAEDETLPAGISLTTNPKRSGM